MKILASLVLLCAVACGTNSSTAPSPVADAGNPDAGTNPDGGTAFTPGAAMTAPAQTWTWVPFPDSHCGNGDTVGLGINLNTSTSRVLIYFEGGGACWSELTCLTLQTAVNFTTGYTRADFTAQSTDTTDLALKDGFFDRTSAANPFKDYSYVYVPYCTGDVHSGSNVVQYGSTTGMHVGYENFTAFLQRIVPTFPNTDRVVIAGSSAGGVGALYNWPRTQAVFGNIRVDMIDDSGTLMPADVAALASGGSIEPTWRTQWNLAATLPSACTGCATDLSSFYGYAAGAVPNSRAAVLTYETDTVIPTFYGISGPQFTTGLNETIASQFTPHANLKIFESSSSGHVLFFNPTIAQGSVTEEQFITKMVTDDSTWSSVTP
jgi:Pectinacetylesterase